MMCRPTTISKTPIDCIKQTRKVSFTTCNQIFEVERVDAALLQDLFYGAADYQRFREERRKSLIDSTTAPVSPVVMVTKPKKHGDDAGYMQRRQRLQRLVATRDVKVTVSIKTPPRPSLSLRRTPRRGPSQQIALQNMRSRVAAASA